MTVSRTLTVVMSRDLLMLSRACGRLRRRNLPVREFSVDSTGQPGFWWMSCAIDTDDATVESLLRQFQNVVGVLKATSSPPGPLSVPERGNATSSPGDAMSSSVRVYYEADTDRARLRDRVFAIIGYGSQGHAHAQNLRGRGARVRGGPRPGGARGEGGRGGALGAPPGAAAAGARGARIPRGGSPAW